MPKRPARKKQKVRSARRRNAKAEQKSGISDVEDLLIGMLMSSGEKAANGTDIEDLIYSATPGLGLLGYSHGFCVGRAATLKLGTDAPLTAVLDRIGLHDSLYYPFSDKAIITSRSRHHHAAGLGAHVHVYESGVIAGYLSTATGANVNVEEKRCTYDGSRECQFIATPLSNKPRFTGIGIERSTSAISLALINSHYSKSGNAYYRALAYLPLLDSRISEQILKFMMIAGEKAGLASGRSHLHAVVSNISNYFGAKSSDAERKGTKTIIKLRYESYNSMQPFIAIPAAILAGFAKSVGRSAQAHFVLNRDGTYTARIEMQNRRR